MTSSTGKTRPSGFSLLEVLLAIGLCAILAVVSVPSISSWLAELRLRAEFDRLTETVQRAKLRADLEGDPQTVVIMRPGGSMTEKGVYPFVPGNSVQWTWRQGEGRPRSAISIDRRGHVEPVSVRVAEEGKYLEGQFDFLTGHLLEKEASF